MMSLGIDKLGACLGALQLFAIGAGIGIGKIGAYQWRQSHVNRNLPATFVAT